MIASMIKKKHDVSAFYIYVQIDSAETEPFQCGDDVERRQPPADVVQLYGETFQSVSFALGEVCLVLEIEISYGT